MTDPRKLARELLPAWQHRLRLDDWFIRISNCKPADKDARSQVDTHPTVRQASIQLRADTPPGAVERQLVHELLHIRFALVRTAYANTLEHTPAAFDKPNGVLWDMGFEAAVEALCDALGLPARLSWCDGKEFNDAFGE